MFKRAKPNIHLVPTLSTNKPYTLSQFFAFLLGVSSLSVLFLLTGTLENQDVNLDWLSFFLKFKIKIKIKVTR